MADLALRVLRNDPNPEPIRMPSGADGIDGWVNRAAGHVISLHGDPNKMYDGRVREFIDLAKPDPAGLPELTNQWRRRNFANVWSGLSKVMLHYALGLNFFIGSLYTRRKDENGDALEPLSLASLRVVTTVAVNAITDAFDDGVGFTLTDFKYHGIGLGTTAAVVGDTDIETELTTQYSSDNLRDTGTQSQPSANIFQTLGDNQVDAGVSLREHGVLTSATVGSGVLLDRHVYALITLSSGESLESTYQFTSTSGG